MDYCVYCTINNSNRFYTVRGVYIIPEDIFGDDSINQLPTPDPDDPIDYNIYKNTVAMYFQSHWNAPLPEFILNELPDILHPNINIYQVSQKYSIPLWQTNKIRKVLQHIYHAYGMRVRFQRYDTFLWGMALSIPDNYVIDSYGTRGNWKSNPTQWKWRKINIYAIPDEALSVFLGIIPFQIDDTVIGGILQQNSTESLPVLPNFTYKNTMAEEIIICNWDKILSILNANGY